MGRFIPVDGLGPPGFPVCRPGLVDGQARIAGSRVGWWIPLKSDNSYIFKYMEYS